MNSKQDAQAASIIDKSNSINSTQSKTVKNEEEDKSGQAKSDTIEPEPSSLAQSKHKSEGGSNAADLSRVQKSASTVGRFFSVSFVGSIEKGYFDGVNDVYVKYSILAGPDWILSAGVDVGITQIARYRLNENEEQQFIWNQPISISFRGYNFYGCPQIVLSVYNFDTFGNDQLLGYGCAHLPISSQISANHRQSVKIYSPQSSSFLKQILSWISGKKPELVDSNLFARSDCRSVLQMVTVGKIELTLNLATKDVQNNGYKTG